MPDPHASASAPTAASTSLPTALQREWLLTDGLGGYACGTAADVPTRRYHAWLCAVPAGQSERVRFLTGIHERMLGAGGEVDLLAAHWEGMDAPVEPEAQRQFHAHPLPTWLFARGELVLERSLAMLPETRAVLVRWRNRGTVPLRLRARPLLACEPADRLDRERSVQTAVQQLHHAVAFRPDVGLPPLWFTHDEGGVFHVDPCWYHGFVHDLDAARGYDAIADRWSPGAFEVELAPGDTCTAAFSVAVPLADPAAAFGKALALCLQRGQWANQARSPLAARLRHGVEDFVYRDANGRLGVLAGFPWFGEWGRDAFLALPGLTLACGAADRCRDVLRGAVPFLRDGLLPNIYGRSPADSHYGSADAALWFALAVQRWHDHGQTRAAVRAEFGDALRAIAESYLAGAALGLRVDADLLLCAGSPEHNATWMDAQLPDGPVTPRNGQPVEIAALWVSLLLYLGELYGAEWVERAECAGRAFLRRFVRADGLGLYDCVTDGVPDPSVRPNMVIAAALARSPLSREQRAAVIAVADARLRTRVGLRTLAPGSDGYRGRYQGGVELRDRAYHQGTVWPWLAGFWVEASLRAAPDAQRRQAAREARIWLEGFLPETERVGIDHVSEVYDGDPPHRPGGTFAQAWNTGELLRALQLCAAAEEHA